MCNKHVDRDFGHDPKCFHLFWNLVRLSFQRGAESSPKHVPRKLDHKCTDTVMFPRKVDTMTPVWPTPSFGNMHRDVLYA